MQYLKILFFLILPFTVSAQIYTGKIISVKDGDSFELLTEENEIIEIRLAHVDTPEKKQICTRNSKEYSCGKKATNALKKKIGRKIIICKVQDKLDRYKRYIGVCFLGDVDLNKWMTRNGYAVAYRRYSKDYIEDENYAKKNKIGLWSGNFIHPEKWRKLN